LNSIELRINYEYLKKCFIREIIIMEEEEYNEVKEEDE
jgi:hypothetical protein